jgi:large subunit GTPase 1
LTPFEKNLEVWRQLWRVIERSDVVAQVVDARDPLFYRSADVEDYARYASCLLIFVELD